MARKKTAPPIVILFGDEAHEKCAALDRVLNDLLPPEVDRAFALTTYDASQSEEQGGPTVAGVLDDLATLPFLANRRVVLVRDADRFISAARESLEKYLSNPAPTGTLVLECRSFPKTTRLYKAAAAKGGELIECRKLTGRALVDFVVDQARVHRKRLAPDAANRLCELIGQDQGLLAMEVEKLALYAGERPDITAADVAELVGQTREEKIFAVADAAAIGRLPEALTLWRQVLDSDSAAAYRSVGGLAFVLRRWLTAHRLMSDGMPLRAVAPKVMMWGREQQLATLLRRLAPERIRRLLAELGDLDAQAKTGVRSIERGVEALLTRIAAPTP